MPSPFSQKFLHRPVAVSMVYGALLLGGIFAFTRLPLELAPSKEFPRLSVVTFWGSTSPETVEMFLTAPIEEIANTVQGVRKVSSTSEEGISTVDIEFEQQTDINFARLELNEKLAAFSENIPAGATPPFIRRYVPKDFRDLQGFLSYSLSGNRSSSELRKYAEETIAPALLSIKGISNVQVLGGENRELQIEIDPAKAIALGFKVDELSTRLRELQFSAPVGAFESLRGRTLVAVRNSSLNVQDIKDFVVTLTSSGTPVRIKDIGNVRDGFSEPRSFYRINGNQTITIVIDKEPNTNTLKLADAVFAKLENLQNAFPAGFRLIKESDKSLQMRKELGKLYQEILVSLICIFFVLFLFLRNITAPLVILSSILFSLAGTFLLFWFFGIGLNLLTLAGLVLGFGRLVDDSIVVLENINRHLHEHSEGRFSSVALSVSEIALPVTASTLTTVGALLPLQFLPQDLKPYFLDFGIAVGISLLMSLLVSFTLIPLVSAHVASIGNHFRFLDSVGNIAMKVYRAVLRFAIRHKKIVMGFTIWMFGLPIWLLPDKIESEGFFGSVYNNTFGSETYKSAKPYVNYSLGGASYLFFAKVTKGELWDFGSQTYLIVTVAFPQGTEIERYNQIAADIEREVLQEQNGIEKLTTRVHPDYSIVRIDIADSASVTSLPFELKNRLVIFAAQTGGASISVSGFGPGFFSGGESSPSFYVKVLGYNYNRVKDIAETFRERIERNPRIAEVDIDQSFGRWNKMYELVVTIDRETVSRYNVTVVDVVRAIRAYTRGAIEQSQLTIHGEQTPYLVKFANYKDFSINDLRQAAIVNAAGEKVRLNELIGIEERRVPAKISRENQQYLRWISFDYKGPYRFGDQFVDASIKAMPLPSGYLFDRSPSFFWYSEENQASLLWIACFALVIVFMITASLYESFVKPFIIILSVPFSLIGLFLSYYLTDTPFGRGGYAAIILLIGIVVTNSIVLVDYISKRIAESGSSTETLIEASSQRVRPVLMTTLTTIGGLLPLWFMGEHSSLWYSLSIGTIGGLVSSTVLTLIIIPLASTLIQIAKRQ